MDYEKLALEYHEREPRGKIQTSLSKPVDSQEDLSIAYSPGVAGPCREIHKNPEDSFKYTGRANLVGVISNGSAVLGLGNIGPLASKPVMEGKAMLFKKFADIDVFDIEVDAPDPDAFITAVKALEPTFGGINLEDIKAPECFYIEENLREMMKIPVFHDDQHGTAIITAAAFLNACEVTERDITKTKVVFSGAGAAAIACSHLLLKLGVQKENLIMCDSGGVIHDGRDPGDKYKGYFSLATDLRTLDDAMENADAFIGVSVANVLKPETVKKMSKNPIIFALANPNPEIHPDKALEVRPDAIIATGRSDFPNQVNNVLGFPFIFRGALDVQATCINDDMKLAAVKAISALAKESVPEEVLKVYKNPEGYRFGRDYLIPKPVDPRVLMYVAPAVAKAAMDSGVARKQVDIEEYKHKIERILGPTRRIVRSMRNNIVQRTAEEKKRPKILLPHGYDSRVIKAAAQVAYEGDVDITLLGIPEAICNKAAGLGYKNFGESVKIIDPLQDERLESFGKEIFKLRERKGVSRSIAEQLVRDHNYFGAMLVKNNFVDGMLSGLVEPYAASVKPLLEVLGTSKDQMLAGIQMMIYRKKLYFFSDCTIHVDPSAEEMAEIAMQTAALAARYTNDPLKLAFLSFSSFGSNRNPKTRKITEATNILRSKNPDFEFDGEIQADVALNEELQRKEFPFSTLGGQANVLIFPDLMSANISYKILGNLTEAKGFGPILTGFEKPVHVLERGATVEEVINMIYLAADRRKN